MCGILGLSINKFSETDIPTKLKSEFREHFDNSNLMLAHRGPDDFGSELFFDEGVFLGHTRLAIQDLSVSGAQPMTSDNDTLIITFNGEIYNFPDLKNDLLKIGYVFSSTSDTEVILNLYAEYGLDSFRMLDGIFALAIFDKKENKLIVARDALGVKPLYFYNDKTSYAFSSEIKALEKLLSKKILTIDPKSINRYLTFQWCPGEGTPYTEIKKHNPGEVFVIRNGVIEERRVFYQSPIFRNIKKRKSSDVSNILQDLDGHLRKAVHDQMLSDAPLGAFLSGGLDSTSVVAFAREVNPNIKCFTIDTRSSSNDGMQSDLSYAISASKYLKVPLEIVTADATSLVRGFEQMVWMLDEPLGDPAALNVYYISRIAKENNIKVLLSGAGGDDIFTGYRRHHATLLDDKMKIIPKSLLSVAEKLSGRLDKRVTLFRRLAKLFNGSSMEGVPRIVNYFKWIDRKELFDLFSDDFKFELESDLAEQPMLDFLISAYEKTSSLDKMLALEQRFFTTDHNLIYTDKASMAAGVEVRVPLLSKNLVEFAATIPDNLKQKRRVGKWIFKKVMEPYLPKDIIYRPKTGFMNPLREWIRFDLSDYVDELLSFESISSRGIFNAKNVKLLLENNKSGKIDASYTIFSLMCIELWCRQHLDGDYNP